jgi:hypothetical protein
MYISKTLEKHLEFANFCREHEVSPTFLAYAIQCCNDMRRAKGFNKKHEWKQKATGFLITMGFENITFENEWPEFDDKLGGRSKLPKL